MQAPQYYSCSDNNIRRAPECYDQCKNDFEYCIIKKAEKTPCAKMLQEEEKWRRVADGLNTAVDVYMDKGFLHNDKQVTIRKGRSFCTTNYGQAGDRDRANNPSWEQLSVYPIDLQFANRVQNLNQSILFLQVSNMTNIILVFQYKD